MKWTEKHSNWIFTVNGWSAESKMSSIIWFAYAKRSFKAHLQLIKVKYYENSVMEKEMLNMFCEYPLLFLQTRQIDQVYLQPVQSLLA